MSRPPHLLLASLICAAAACSNEPATPNAPVGDSDAARDDVPLDEPSPTEPDADAPSPDGGPPPVEDAGPNACTGAGTAGATARCLAPTQTPEYYVDQALRYFDTLDISADRERVPNYHETVARWEWPPWLLLTGFGRDNMNETADSLRRLDPSTVPERDCRFFDTQPFARCYVVFEYENGPCPIYEEFVFNDEGEMTFIEAWSDLDGLRPTEGDRWAEAPDFPRLGTRVPGLGFGDGAIVADTPQMRAAAEQDEELADFVRRTENFWGTWFAELRAAPPDFFAQGCGW